MKTRIYITLAVITGLMSMYYLVANESETASQLFDAAKEIFTVLFI